MIEEKNLNSNKMVEENIESTRSVESEVEVLREKSGIDLNKDIIDHNKNINLVEQKINDGHVEKDYGGLDGNPGQRSRFNHMMENRGGNLNKYFWSGRR